MCVCVIDNTDTPATDTEPVTETPTGIYIIEFYYTIMNHAIYHNTQQQLQIILNPKMVSACEYYNSIS